MTPDRDLSMKFSGCPLASRGSLNFKRPPSNFSFEDLVLSNLIASPLMKLYSTPGGWHEAKCVNWKFFGRLVTGFDVQDKIFCESFSFKNTVVSRKVIWFSDI